MLLPYFGAIFAPSAKAMRVIVDYLVQRLFWAGLALVPVASLAFASGGGMHPVLAMVSGGGSAAALVAAFGRFGRKAERSGPRLLRPSALRTPPPDLPDAQTRLAMVQVALRGSGPVDASVPTDGPGAIARILTRVVEARGGAVTPDDTIELVLLMRLLTAEATRAGALAQLFVRPDLVLDLRDEVNAAIRRRAAFDRDMAALEAGQALWRGGQRAFGGPLRALQALGVPDQDLWHAVMRDGPLDAATWCATQPECDRASVALFLARVARDKALDQALAQGDGAFVDRIAAILRRWNAGGYGIGEIAIAFDGPEEQALRDALDRLALASGAPRLPEPCGLFATRAGHPPRDRGHWCLHSGRLLRAPHADAYLERHMQ